MNPQYQTLYVFSAIAVATMFARVSSEPKAGLLDWIALGSLGMLFAQVILLGTR